MALNQINRDRLVACLRKEAAQYGNEHFNLAYYTQDPNGFSAFNSVRQLLGFESPSELHTCGSTACVIGTWNTYHPEELLDITEDVVWVDVDDPPRSSYHYQSITTWLGISELEARGIFGFFGWQDYYETQYPSIHEVIQVLEAL